MPTPWPDGPTLKPGGSWTVAHDFAYVYGGAERVTAALVRCTGPGTRLAYLSGRASVVDEISSGESTELFPHHFFNERIYRALAPLYPLHLAQRAPVHGNLLASSYAFAHHIRCTGRKVVYCHTPLRQIWSGATAYDSHQGRVGRAVSRGIRTPLREIDRAAAASADLYIATSTSVRQRLFKFYGVRDAPIVPPPVDTDVFSPRTGGPRSDYLWVGRIVEPYKRLDVAIEAFRGLDARLTVVGDGRDRVRLEATAPSNVRFVGWKNAAELVPYYRSARAVVFPSEDDFGLVPVESMACGTPSLAYRAGGAADTVVEGETGLFFEAQEPAALRDAIRREVEHLWDERRIAAHAADFGRLRFTTTMNSLLAGVLEAGSVGTGSC